MNYELIQQNLLKFIHAINGNYCLKYLPSELIS